MGNLCKIEARQDVDFQDVVFRSAGAQQGAQQQGAQVNNAGNGAAELPGTQAAPTLPGSNRSREEAIAKAVKKGESYKFTDELDRLISTDAAFTYLVNTKKLTELDQHKWKSKMSMMMREEGKTLSECIGIATKEVESLPEIRVVDFEVFRSHGEIPRLGKGESLFHIDAPGHDLTTNIKNIDKSNSLIVFISHSWIVGFDGKDDCGNIVSSYQAEHWRGWPHPDTADNSKYHLQVQAIEYLWKNLAPGMKKCYIWQDFSCMDQNGNPAGELKQLDKIIEFCDCILTPIVDDEHEAWSTPTAWNNYFKDYAAPNFSLDGGPYSYTNRCWCRVEMFYAANIPMDSSNKSRLEKFAHGLKFAQEKEMRPHYVYGSKEVASRKGPIQLPPLSDHYLNVLSPKLVMSNLTCVQDAEKIIELMVELEPYIKKAAIGYDGETNSAGQRHGMGTYTWGDDSSYVGEWSEGVISGKGVYKFADGSMYDGCWLNTLKHGYGEYTFSGGDLYKGLWDNNLKRGKGVYVYTHGDKYDGLYENDMKNGVGEYWWSDGRYYKGNWVNEQQAGHGEFLWTNGDRYIGNWGANNREGKGKYWWVDGRVYDGDWRNGKQHGKGHFTFATGDTYVGDWREDNRHGQGTYVWQGVGTYTGEWVNSKQHGTGVYTQSDGKKYRSSYANGAAVGEKTWLN